MVNNNNYYYYSYYYYYYYYYYDNYYSSSMSRAGYVLHSFHRTACFSFGRQRGKERSWTAFDGAAGRRGRKHTHTRTQTHSSSFSNGSTSSGCSSIATLPRRMELRLLRLENQHTDKTPNAARIRAEIYHD